MPVKLKAATFDNNELKKTGTSVVHLEPDTGSEAFQAGFCVKVVNKSNTAQYWGGKVQSVGGAGKAMARLKYQVGHCTNVPEAADRDDAKGGSPPRGTPDDTTDVSVTIDNTSTVGDKSTVDTTSVKILP
jgi:hypothetical protein